MKRSNRRALLLVIAIAFCVLLGRCVRSRDARPGIAPGVRVSAPTETPNERLRHSRSRYGVSPGAHLQLSGQVISEDGAGVAGAQISLSGAQTVSAGADGRFVFPDVDAIQYVLRATAGALTSGPVPARAPGPILIRVEPGGTLAVHVVTDGGVPLPGAEVGLDDTTAIAKTDATGTATLPAVHGSARVAVSSPGYATSERLVEAPPGKTAELTVALRRGYAVSGVVVDAAHHPVSGARVGAREGLAGGGLRGAEATTDGEGRFTVPALAAGPHTLVASDGEHAPTEAAPITIADAPVTGVTIALGAGYVLAGEVLGADATPAPGATVRVVGRGPAFVRELRSDARGRFEARGLPRGFLQLQAESDDATSDVVDVDLASADDRSEVRLVLDAAASIGGTVVDARGAPVAGAQVTAFPDAADDADQPYGVVRAAPATSDRDGGFALRGLRAGRYRLLATAAGLRSPGERGVTAAAGDQHVRIALASGGGLRGRLRLSKTGEAPARAELQLGDRAPVTVSHGAIDVARIPPGTYDAVLRGPDFAERVTRGVIIQSGQVTELGAIELTAGRTLTGKVVDLRGAPVAGAEVQLQSGGRATTGADGQFQLAGVPTEATSVAATASRGRSNAQAIEAGPAAPAPIVLVLRALGSVAGTINVRGAQAPITVALISADDPGHPISARASDEGTFRFAAVPEGAYAVSAVHMQAAAMRTANTRIDVAAGAETRVALEFPHGAITLAVQVAGAAAANVFLFRGGVAAATERELQQAAASGKLAGMQPWRPDGDAPTFEALTPDVYSVCAVAARAATPGPRSPDGAVACRRVDVLPAPSEQTVTCALPGG